MHLRYLKDTFDAMMILYSHSIIDVQWWYNNINSSKNNITKSEPFIEISSVSSFGWAVCKVNLLLKFHLLVVLGGLSATIFALEGHLTLLK